MHIATDKAAPAARRMPPASPTASAEYRPKVDKRILRINEVVFITGLSKTTVYRYCADGIFPDPVPLGGSRIGWLLTEVEAWVESRVAARDATRRSRSTAA